MNKNAIKKFAIEARKKLINSVTDKAGMLGITEKSCSEPITKGADFEVYQTVAGTEVTLNKRQCEQRRRLVSQIESRGFEAVIEEVAYTWFNRICAIRFMEVNDYLPNRVRVLSSEKEGKKEPDIVTTAPNVGFDLSDRDIEFLIRAKAQNELDEVFKFLFLKECNYLHQYLPELFEETEDYSELLLHITFTNEDGVIRCLIDNIEESDFLITTIDENGEEIGQVEIIGWLYQYYISEPKDNLINEHKKYSAENIPIVTQLFTSEWIVKFIVENSLGRYWIESTESRLGDELEYYFDNGIHIKDNIKPETIKVFDPCMGSGHMLVYSFEILMKIYLESGYSTREAAENILKYNIYGVDIDKRAYQIAYFSVFMKARQYNRRIFEKLITPNLGYFESVSEINKNQLSAFGNKLNLELRNKAENDLLILAKRFKDANVIGSLLEVDDINFEIIEQFINDCGIEEQLTFDSLQILKLKEQLRKAVDLSQLLKQRYDIVVTNPPYLNSRYMPNEMRKYLDENYSDIKSDMFSAFIYRCTLLCKDNGLIGMLTPYVWMFISGYEELRAKLLKNTTISALVQLEYNAFEAACVPVCAFTLRNYKSDFEGNYIKLSEFKGTEVQAPKTLEACKNRSCGYYYKVNQNIFTQIPGIPFAYWVSKQFVKNFQRGISIDSISDFTGSQNITADNNKYLREWWEVDKNEINRGVWKLYAKGGEFRKWYGNLELVVDWSDSAIKFYRENKSSNLLNERYWNQEGITYTEFTSSVNTFRYLPPNCIFDKKGPSIVRLQHLEYCLAILNSPIADMYFKVFNPSVSTQVRDVKNLPLILDLKLEETIKQLVKRNIELAKEDWDFAETSIDFKKHKLVYMYKEGSDNIETLVGRLIKLQLEHFYEMKENEEKINRLIISSYGFENELSCYIEDDMVSYKVYKEDEIIKSLLSYCVGCIFGRYAKDELREYIDKDNIIPITDEEYFEDDIVGKICEIIRKIFGNNNYEANLDYIGNILNYGFADPKENIRMFFVKDFYDYHCKMYKKRPIYWMANSGKSNGFKALFYIHRYESELFGNLRVDYLHRVQKFIENNNDRALYIKESSNSSLKEKKAAIKKNEKYIKQLKEISEFDEAIAYIANHKVQLVIRNGVKSNYDSLQKIVLTTEGMKDRVVEIMPKIR